MNQTFLNFRNLYKIWRKEFNINSNTFTLVFIQRGKKGLNKRIDRNNFLFFLNKSIPENRLIFNVCKR